MNSEPSSPRTAVKRKPGRGVYDRDRVYAILDEALTCTVGFVEDGQPFVIPTVHARNGDRLYFHGSPANRTLTALAEGVPCCVTVVLVDGIVLGRTAKKHSLNYRSAMILGTAREVANPDEKRSGLMTIIEHMIPGRSCEIPPPEPAEVDSTLLLSLALEEVSAKIRSGDPSDPPSAHALPVWAGHLPLSVAPLSPVPDPNLPVETPVPEYLQRWRRERS